MSLSRLACELDLTRPQVIDKQSVIIIKGGRHPLQELVVDQFVPNDAAIGVSTHAHTHTHSLTHSHTCAHTHSFVICGELHELELQYLEPYKVTADTPRRPPPAAAAAEDDDQVCLCAGTHVSLRMCRHAIICLRCPALRDR